MGGDSEELRDPIMLQNEEGGIRESIAPRSALQPLARVDDDDRTSFARELRQRDAGSVSCCPIDVSCKLRSRKGHSSRLGTVEAGGRRFVAEAFALGGGVRWGGRTLTSCAAWCGSRHWA